LFGILRGNAQIEIWERMGSWLTIKIGRNEVEYTVYMHCNDAGWPAVAGSCEYGIEPSGSIKVGELVEY
jgi:hypothetical protein